jgi:hypothetical protein
MPTIKALSVASLNQQLVNQGIEIKEREIL